MLYTKKELEEILAVLKSAYIRAADSGGVTSYSINSGQGTTTVNQASMASIRAEIEHYEDLLNEITETESGSHCISIQGIGFM
ncbi:TPA: hypothetical protein IAA87_05830 [Candidatus Avigastranaerophilus faecigallinarum]|nr:hypothetical protein [Candidatus Avigastranaerophilus faecigallinarum]